MGIIYTITLLAILVVFMLVKKSDNKLNGVGAFGLGMVLILCYNVLECYILNFAKIKLTLLNLSIVNFIVLVPAIIYLLKSKKIQKYYVNNNDVMSITIIGICVLLFAIMQYG